MSILQRPEGIWGAILLPVKNDKIDWVAFEEQVNILCDSRVHGIYTNGTAAECHNQTEEEFDKLSNIVSSIALKKNKKFQLGLSHTNPRICRERAIRLTSLKPDGFQITLPDWWPPTYQESLNFIMGMQEVVEDRYLILYNPPHAKVLLSLEEISQLNDKAPNLIGIKCAGGDEAWYKNRRALLEDFSVFVPGHSVVFAPLLLDHGSAGRKSLQYRYPVSFLLQ